MDLLKRLLKMWQAFKIMYVLSGKHIGGTDADSILQQLGECLGKGAFGSVYKALNWGTGETVAVKQVKLADLPKSELRVIMVHTAERSSFTWKMTDASCSSKSIF
jgi:serine/threonine protein kinase